MARRIRRTSKRRIGFEAITQLEPRSLWKKILARPHIALLIFAAILVLFVGIAGLVLPVIPGVAVIVLGVAMFFYGANKFLE